MRKITAFALSFALSLSLCVPAFASEATVTETGGKQEIGVNAKYVDSVETPTVYDVDVAWGAMEFTYTVSGTKTWDAEKHEYIVSTGGAWTATGNEITVTNHSDTGIKADFAYASDDAYNTVVGTFSNNSVLLPTAEGKATTDASLTAKTALTLDGTLASDKTDLTKVGKVTVSISKA